MPRETEPPQINQVFLSATAQDCKNYRESVRDFVHDNLPAVKIFLQEHWAEGASFVVAVCEQKVKNCDAYLGLFGHRYGWTPPGFTKSITELEFLWAVDRWKQAVPPIFILLPEKNSEADDQLKNWAKPLLEKEFPDEASRAAAQADQQAFLSLVIQWAAADGRILVYYRNHTQLIGKALSCIQNWNRDLLLKALQGRRTAVGEIPADELGRIGRESQLQVLVKAMDVFFDRDQERAVAFLVHGPENYGQREFSYFLHSWEDWESANTQVFCGQAPEPDNIDALICWACGQLQEPTPGTPTVEALANTLAARLARKSVVFIVRSLGHRSERLTAFLDQLWKPLVDKLAAYPVNGRGRLYWFVIDHAKLTDGGIHGIWRDALDAANVDYHKLLPLPALGEIRSSDIRRWLKELNQGKVISVDDVLREDIAQRVTKDDGIPPNVYNRLALEGFWA